MTFQFDGHNWLVRLEKGELLVASLTQLVSDEKITGAWVSGLGGAQWAELGFYDLPHKTYQWKKFKQLLEITSVQGTVAWQGDVPILHLHGTFADQSMQAIGGHIKELQVGGTAEILLHHWYGDSLVRIQDNQTGLKILSL